MYNNQIHYEVINIVMYQYIINTVIYNILTSKIYTFGRANFPI